MNRIKQIDWDEGYMIIRHDSGKARVLDPVFKPFLPRLLELNPTIAVPDDLPSSLEEEVSRHLAALAPHDRDRWQEASSCRLFSGV